MPLVSIIVPVYKTKEEYLRKCIESLINQSLKDIEIILVDDGSPYNCGEICDDYAADDARIKVIHQTNQGVSISRNKGINASTAKWVTFVDSDDWIESNMCEVIYKEAENREIDILIFGNYVNTVNKEIENPYFKTDIDCFKDNLKMELELKTMTLAHKSFSFNPSRSTIGATWGKLINRDFLLRSNIRFKKELVRAQDIIFYINLFEETERIAYINRFLYHYRLSEDSAVSRYREDTDKVLTLVLGEYEKFIVKYKKPQIYWDIYNIRAFNTLRICTTVDFFHKDNPKSLGRRLKELRLLLKSEPYHSALRDINKGDLSWRSRIYVFLLKKRLVVTIWFLKNIALMKSKEMKFS